MYLRRTKIVPGVVGCTQANYSRDGTYTSEPISYLRHLSRLALQLVVGITSQWDVTFLPRVDPDLFLSSISCVIDGKRTQAPAWDLAPAWKGEDVQNGKEYTDLLQSAFNVSSLSELAEKDPDSLLQLWNSDNYMTEHPFDRPQITQTRDAWIAHIKEEALSIPLCAINGESKSFKRYQSKRKGTMDRIRGVLKRKRVEKEGDDEDEDAVAEVEAKPAQKKRKGM